MKQVIYVDVLIVLNTFVNYFLLITTSLLLKTDTKRMRIILSSLAGGIFSLSALFDRMNFFLSLLLRIVIAAVLVLICFGAKTFPFFIKHFLMFFTVTFLFAGIMSGIWLMFRPNGMIYKNTAIYFDVNIWVLIGASAVCYLIIKILSKVFGRNPVSQFNYDFSIEIFGKEISGKAMLDTGNSLTEIFTGYPVAVCTYSSVKGILPSEIRAVFENGNIENISDDEWKKRIRIVNCMTVSGSKTLLSFRPDNLKIITGVKSFSTDKVYIALSTERNYINERYDMLINNNLLERKENE